MKTTAYPGSLKNILSGLIILISSILLIVYIIESGYYVYQIYHIVSSFKMGIGLGVQHLITLSILVSVIVFFISSFIKKDNMTTRKRIAIAVIIQAIILALWIFQFGLRPTWEFIEYYALSQEMSNSIYSYFILFQRFGILPLYSTILIFLYFSNYLIGLIRNHDYLIIKTIINLLIISAGVWGTYVHIREVGFVFSCLIGYVFFFAFIILAINEIVVLLKKNI